MECCCEKPSVAQSIAKVRFSYATSDENIRTAVARIKEALAALK